MEAPSFQIVEPPEAFPQLPALAKRLGVEPNTGDSRVHLLMKDGTRYDVFALVNAFLDRLDGIGTPADQAER